MATAHNPRTPFAALLALFILCLSTTVCSTPLEGRTLPGTALSPYAFKAATCPSTPLLRSGRKLSPSEHSYATKRKAKADKSLKKWLGRTGKFPTLKRYPMLSMANGGGGLRGFLTSAGMHLAYDSKSGLKYSTSGLYQAMTYESGLSGSAIMLSSYVENDQPETMELYETLWKGSIENGLFEPGGPSGVATALAGIVKDVLAKQVAGGPVSGIDVLARLFGYVAFKPDKAGPAGVNKIFSESVNLPAYRTHNHPIPIFGALGIESIKQGCGLPPKNVTQYEFTPFEFGSFDRGVEAFTPMKYLGSSLDNGKPTSGSLLRSACVTGFDNTNFAIGTSTAELNDDCIGNSRKKFDSIIDKGGLKVIKGVFDQVAGLTQAELYSYIPNMAYNSHKSPLIKNMTDLLLIDGGENIQVVPLWPMLFRPELDVVFISDSGIYGEGLHKTYLPNGDTLSLTKTQAERQGVGHRLPDFPAPKTFLKKGYTKRPYFFGCYSKPDSPALTIIYCPNTDYTYNSNVNTSKNKLNATESLGLLLNGAQVATNGNDPKFGFCAGCAVMKRASEREGKKLPDGCESCFKEYCIN